MIEQPPSKTEIVERKLRSVVQEIGDVQSHIHVSVVAFGDPGQKLYTVMFNKTSGAVLAEWLSKILHRPLSIEDSYWTLFDSEVDTILRVDQPH